MGMHFMNPPTFVTLIELIRGRYTSDETFQIISELSQGIGRKVIVQSKDHPAFIANRVLMTGINEAAWAVYEGIASAEDVNQTILMGVGTSKAMPILELADLIGLDICLDILKFMHEKLGAKYKPCPLFEEMTRAGKLGYKSGEGFFKYPKK
jgi:3-hydroxybutyryl-CoA dehydrogenase